LNPIIVVIPSCSARGKWVGFVSGGLRGLVQRVSFTEECCDAIRSARKSYRSNGSPHANIWAGGPASWLSPRRSRWAASLCRLRFRCDRPRRFTFAPCHHDEPSSFRVRWCLFAHLGKSARTCYCEAVRLVSSTSRTFKGGANGRRVPLVHGSCILNLGFRRHCLFCSGGRERS
jgi:hypothetical protein